MEKLVHDEIIYLRDEDISGQVGPIKTISRIANQ